MLDIYLVDQHTRIIYINNFLKYILKKPPKIKMNSIFFNYKLLMHPKISLQNNYNKIKGTKAKTNSLQNNALHFTLLCHFLKMIYSVVSLKGGGQIPIISRFCKCHKPA